MPDLPSTLRVKISSEHTEMAVTPVVSRDMPVEEIALQIVSVAGKNSGRRARAATGNVDGPAHRDCVGPA